MKKMLMVVMACYAFTARSQVDPSRNFAYLYSDSVIYAGRVSLRPDFNDSWQLRADRRRIPVEQVKFVNNEEGFFANIRKLNFIGSVGFAERVIDGKINLFKEITFDSGHYDWRYRRVARSVQAADPRNYYNKGMGDLKRVNYTNLQVDMSDNPQSMDLLRGYRKSITTRNVLYTAAGASILASFISLVSFSPNEKTFSNGMAGHSMSIKSPNYLPAGLLLGAGLGFAIGGWSAHLSSNRKLENAIDAYNR